MFKLCKDLLQTIRDHDANQDGRVDCAYVYAMRAAALNLVRAVAGRDKEISTELEKFSMIGSRP